MLIITQYQMAIKMFIMFIIGDTTSAFGSLCNLGLGEDSNHRCDMLLIVMLFLEQVLFLFYNKNHMKVITTSP